MLPPRLTWRSAVPRMLARGLVTSSWMLTVRTPLLVAAYSDLSLYNTVVLTGILAREFREVLSN